MVSFSILSVLYVQKTDILSYADLANEIRTNSIKHVHITFTIGITLY